MTLKTLENTTTEELRIAFNIAFSDYEVKTDMTEESFISFLNSNSVDLSISTGLFDADKLIGFILVGRRGKALYDGGTAVIKEYRGKGYARKMLSFTIDNAKKHGFSTFELEVLKNNERAIKLYKSFGFKEKEHYVCFNISSMEGREIILEEQPITKLKELEEKMEFKPSWQNSYQSIDSASRLFTAQDGFIAIRKTGSIVAIDSKNYDTYKSIITSLLHSYPKLRFVNQDESNPFIKELLKEKETSVFAYQYRMELTL